MKKIASLVFAVVALSVVVAGCAKSEEAKPAEGTTNTQPTGSGTADAPK